MLRQKFRARLFHFTGKNGIPLGHAVTKNPACQFDAGNHQHEPAGENFFQQIEHGKLDVHLAGRRVAGIEMRKARFLRRILDEPHVEQHPEDQNGGGNVKNRPGCIERRAGGRKHFVQQSG